METEDIIDTAAYRATLIETWRASLRSHKGGVAHEAYSLHAFHTVEAAKRDPWHAKSRRRSQRRLKRELEAMAQAYEMLRILGVRGEA